MNRDEFVEANASLLTQEHFSKFVTELLRCLAGGGSVNVAVEELAFFLEAAQHLDPNRDCELLHETIENLSKAVLPEEAYGSRGQLRNDIAAYALRLAAERTAKDKAARGRLAQCEVRLEGALKLYGELRR